MTEILVIDTSSLINLTKYYIFDRHHENQIYTKFIDFITSKINIGEIVIIDKVYHNEWKENKYNRDIRKKIRHKVIDTIFLINEIQNLIENYQNKENILKFSPEQIDLELDEYENIYADLYLIGYCKHLINDGKKTILITEETRGKDNKIIHKIPTICKKENIKCHKLPYLIFEIYRYQLQFELKIYT